MIKDLHCSIALMCIAPKTSAFSFRRPAPQFLFACQCSGRDSAYQSATLLPSPRTALFEGAPSRPENRSGLFDIFLSNTGGTSRTASWHAITGEATLASPEKGELSLRLVDVKNSHEINVAIPIPLGIHRCNIRKEMNQWSDVRISLAGNTDQYKFISKPIVKITGKACYAKHYPLHGHETRRFFSGSSDQKSLAMWEIYPVMKHDLINAAHGAEFFTSPGTGLEIKAP